jgi:hypothetical protein
MGAVAAEGEAGRGVRAIVGIVLISVVLAGCSGSLGMLPRVAAPAPTAGYKMLRPGVTVTECEGGSPWARRDSDLLGKALQRLLEHDAEADLVINAQIESTGWSLGIYWKRCVTVTGDVVRTTTTVLLPMPGSHGDHDGH